MIKDNENLTTSEKDFANQIKAYIKENPTKHLMGLSTFAPKNNILIQRKYSDMIKSLADKGLLDLDTTSNLFTITEKFKEEFKMK